LARRLELTRFSRQLREDFLILGEAADLILGEDVRPIDGDIENAAAAFDEFRLDSRVLFDFVRQTGGRGVVVSLHAVRDGNLHGSSAVRGIVWV